MLFFAFRRCVSSWNLLNIVLKKYKIYCSLVFIKKFSSSINFNKQIKNYVTQFFLLDLSNKTTWLGIEKN